MKKIITHLIILGLLSVVSVEAGNGIFHYRPDFHGPMFNLTGAMNDTDSVAVVTKPNKYPARGLMLSLVVPGGGQLYAGSKLKSALFFAVEIGGWLIWRDYTNRGEDERLSFENFADRFWSLTSWVNVNFISLFHEYPEVGIKGTHHITLLMPDSSFVSSDTLYSGWIEGAIVVRDHEFYENIGKYNQFVSGWIDSTGSTEWWREDKKIGNNVENILMTYNKKDYLDKRARHNELLKFAKYSITAVMFNHLFSAIDAAWEIKKSSSKKKIDVTANLFFSPYSSMGIGGIKVSLLW
ncbi:MAG: hypothetical protein IIA61_10335 [Candidatus Marinimicrobia bacterium]|nr:hypothetical protein [Candidatus Neomarinimicrobiota bacterium]